MVRLASMNSRRLSDMTSPRTTRANVVQFTQPMTSDQQQKALAEDRENGEVEQSVRYRQKRIDEAHQQGVDLAAEIAGDHADDDADERGDDDAHEADQQCDACAVDQPGEHIAPEMVGAEYVRQRSACPARTAERGVP